MACEAQLAQYQSAQDPAAKNAAYQALKACQASEAGRQQAVAEQQQQQQATAAQQAATQAYRAQQAAIAAQYAAGGALTDLAQPDYQSNFVLPTYQAPAKPAGNVGLILAGIFGGGILLLVMLYFMMKSTRGPSMGYGRYPGYKKK